MIAKTKAIAKKTHNILITMFIILTISRSLFSFIGEKTIAKEIAFVLPN